MPISGLGPYVAKVAQVSLFHSSSNHARIRPRPFHYDLQSVGTSSADYQRQLLSSTKAHVKKQSTDRKVARNLPSLWLCQG